jgi:gamma-glutamylcysteine synthetase
VSFARSQAVADLAARFAAGFDKELRGPRTVGREAEYPVVTQDGFLADVRELLPDLMAAGDLAVTRDASGQVVSLDGNGLTFVLEVGLGTLELITGPCPDLHALNAAHDGGLARLVSAASAHDWRVLGLGIQPRTPRSTEIMTPKDRYGVLHEVIGDGWLWFCLTASDQIHVDVSRDEAIAANDLANLLAGVTIALCANSSVHGDSGPGWCSTREAGMGEIGAGQFRHGMPGGPAVTFEGHVGSLLALPYLMHKIDGRPVPVGVPFDAWLAEHGVHYDAFLLHEHYVWHSARPRSRQGTVELRAACQQPPDSPHVAAALHLGLIEAHRELAGWVASLFGLESWPILRAWHGQVLRLGLAAEQPAPGFLLGVLSRCKAALDARELGEGALLDPLFLRLERGENPAQEATRLLAEGGLPTLLAARSFQP